jgi:hypothetical protein
MRVVQIGSSGEILMWSDIIEPDGVSFFQCPDDYSMSKYSYTPLPGGSFNSSGFVLKESISGEINYVKRAENIQKMNKYMLNEVGQNVFDVFLSDIVVHSNTYKEGSNRIITWVETLNKPEYSGANSGFKTRSYKGELINGIYPRAEAILAILNDL